MSIQYAAPRTRNSPPYPGEYARHAEDRPLMLNGVRHHYRDSTRRAGCAQLLRHSACSTSPARAAAGSACRQNRARARPMSRETARALSVARHCRASSLPCVTAHATKLFTFDALFQACDSRWRAEHVPLGETPHAVSTTGRPRSTSRSLRSTRACASRPLARRKPPKAPPVCR